VHCLREAERTWDHLFPVSWYPDSTPDNLERWKFPSCLECNGSYGRLEDDLLLRFGLCVDPATAEASGISERVRRSFDPSAARDDSDRAAREARLRKVVAEIEFAKSIPFQAENVLPGFGPRYGAEPTPITLDRRDIHRYCEKVARGLTYLRQGLFLDSPVFDFFEDPGRGEVMEQLLVRFGEQFDRGPGVQVRYAPASDRPLTSLWSIVLWGTFRVWGAVRQSSRA
jgi:hypothetical protein